jgi:AcrR family transcriptional regulator
MKKGEQTREVIIHRAARLFNEQGYYGASLSDIMRATGLEKGGIYNHFGSKEELALEAFDYSVGLVNQRIRAAIHAHPNTYNRLVALIEAFSLTATDPVLPGGCPIMKTVIEADDSQPALKERAHTELNRLFESIRYTLRIGVERGEMRPGVDSQKLASLIIASVEGGIMLSRLYQDSSHIDAVVAYLKDILEQNLRP